MDSSEDKYVYDMKWNEIKYMTDDDWMYELFRRTKSTKLNQ